MHNDLSDCPLPLLCRLLYLQTLLMNLLALGRITVTYTLMVWGCSGTLGDKSVHTHRRIYIYVCGDERKEGRAGGRKALPHLEETGGGTT